MRTVSFLIYLYMSPELNLSKRRAMLAIPKNRRPSVVFRRPYISRAV